MIFSRCTTHETIWLGDSVDVSEVCAVYDRTTIRRNARQGVVIVCSRPSSQDFCLNCEVSALFVVESISRIS